MGNYDPMRESLPHITKSEEEMFRVVNEVIDLLAKNDFTYWDAEQLAGFLILEMRRQKIQSTNQCFDE